MSFRIYDASAPLFVRGLGNMAAWLDKALDEGRSEPELMQARLAPDMRPLPAQYQLASDAAKGAVARLTGIAAPAMPDTEASFAELKDRCRRTMEFIEGVDPAAFEGAETREAVVRLPGGAGWRFAGADYLTRFALPNFSFHVTTAYAILRSRGVALGKADYLRHLDPPGPLD